MEIKHPFNVLARKAGKDWLAGFLKRNPELSLRKAENVSINRAAAFNRSAVGKFYENLSSVMTEHEVPKSRIFNVDESGISTVMDNNGKILAARGKKRVGIISSGERGVLTTVVCAMGATGTYIPPLFVFKGKRMDPVLKNGVPPDSHLWSERLWVDYRSAIPDLA